ncbi:MAG: secretion system protein E [Candidatus Omnitrophica bacterium CG11_big_fil_rev_8_21_14_0_20_42_13]|uniref:Secretion system protein E n=1 Tax=Candidatus Ghiorseimicrobium undicola TaxID=1974746 RepID=A0A2H0LYA8_9BACT|nr:MAG: secretion system protein E [Candidatus Omnitrophica bacterium CG11_big_fil_rev_8_21_14_0_20_42_13]
MPKQKENSGPFNQEELEKLITVSEDAGIPPINLNNYKVETDVLRLVPEHLARSYKIMPLAKMGSVLTVAMVDPFEVYILDNLKIITKCNIQPVVATAIQIRKSQDDYYSSVAIEQLIKDEIVKEKEKTEEKEKQGEGISLQKPVDEVIDVEEITKISQDTAIVNMVNGIIRDAIEMRASDIHIEPYSDVLRLRYRVDGIMREMTPLFRENTNAIIARIKIISGLDITIRRLPQDGRFTSKFASRQVDFRVSILPIHFGEKAVLRILDKSSMSMDLEKLGFSPYAFEAFTKASNRPYGMILLTGPTGSGKSTTLYSIMNRLNTPQKHLVTVEDPVEYQLQGLTQIQIKADIGFNFAAALRAVLRQSPDVIMIGEIRDSETVDIAMKAALTGHIILSTLHTNDAPSAIVRLMDMQVEPFLISSTLILIAAQRLARKICPKCKESYEVAADKISGLPDNIKEKTLNFYRGKGCPDCEGTGYSGRVAIVEALLLDEKIKQMVMDKISIEEIRDYARKHGMRTLREDALEKGMRGEISLEEIMRVTPAE